MMATHRNLVAYQQADGQFVRMDSEIEYAGPPNWKFEPLDPEAKAIWESSAAQPERVDDERRAQWHIPTLRPEGNDGRYDWEVR